jgi:hypothetical protein
MIICESIQFVEELQADVGISCAHFDLIQQLDHLITMSSVFEFIQIQLGIYTVILIFSWSKHGLKRAKP